MSNPSIEPSEPRIIKKKKVSPGHHGGAWKVAYADFVTAMMALFIALWIMSQSQSMRQAVAQYFKNPGVLPGSVGIMETSDMGGKMPTPGQSQDLQTASPVASEMSQDRNSLEEVKKRIEEMIAQLPELENLKNQVLMEITAEGLRIELLERENSNFFDIGSANVKPETKKILSLIATELGGLPNKVTIEGHTDSRPYGNQSYTNWELSADRANAARRLMETSGLKPDHVFAVRGFADRQLRNRQDPLDFQNRRVSIIVMFQNPKDRDLLKNSNLDRTKAFPRPEPGPSAEPPQELELPKPPAEPPTSTGQNPDDAAQDVLGKNPVGDEISRQLKPMLPQIREGW
jgi:chemotaxis protein MotB